MVGAILEGEFLDGPPSRGVESRVIGIIVILVFFVPPGLLLLWAAQLVLMRENRVVLFLRLFRRPETLATVTKAAMGRIGSGFRLVTLDAAGSNPPRFASEARVEITDDRALDRAVRLLRNMSRKLLGPERMIVVVPGEDWQRVVFTLAREASMVLIDVSEPSEALLWEMTMIGGRVRPRWVLVGEENAVGRL